MAKSNKELPKSKLAKQDLVTKAQLEQQLVNIAYQTRENLAEHIKHLTANSNWKVLATSHEMEAATKSEFKAVAFINKDTKQVVIAHAGTQVSASDIKQSLEDIWADMQLAAKITPDRKLESIKAFITEIQGKLQKDAEEYSFSTTGHSLGSVLSDLAAVEMLSRGMKVTDSVTFDNPGSRPVIEHALKAGLFTKIEETKKTTEEMTVKSIQSEIFFASVQAQKPNVVSRVNEQMGQEYIKVQDVQSAEKHEGSASTTPSDTESSYLVYLFNKVGSIISTVTPLLNVKNATTVYELLNSYENPATLVAVMNDLNIVQEGLIKKIQEEMVQPLHQVKSSMLKVVIDIAKIFTGISGCYAGSYGPGLVAALSGSAALPKDAKELASDVVTAYNKLAIFAHSLAVVDGHSMKYFADINGNNLLQAIEGTGVEGKQLVLKVNEHQIEQFKALKVQKEAEKDVKSEGSEVQEVVKQQSFTTASGLYATYSKAVKAVKSKLVKHTVETVEQVKLITDDEDDTVVISHEELKKFCSDNVNVAKVASTESSISQEITAAISFNAVDYDTGNLFDLVIIGDAEASAIAA